MRRECYCHGPTLNRARDVEVTIITKRPSGTKRFSATAAFLGWCGQVSSGGQLVTSSSPWPHVGRQGSMSEGMSESHCELQLLPPGLRNPDLHGTAFITAFSGALALSWWSHAPHAVICSCHFILCSSDSKGMVDASPSFSHCPNMKRSISVPSNSVQVAGTGV